MEDIPFEVDQEYLKDMECSICLSKEIYYYRIVEHVSCGMTLRYCQECFYEYGGRDEDYEDSRKELDIL